jgi:general secretion pathway protein L
MPADRDPSASASRFARAAGRRAGAAAFWNWWIGELAPLVPRATRSAMRRRRLRPVLAFDGDAITLWTPVMQGGDVVMQPQAHIATSQDATSVAMAGQAALEPLHGIAGGASRRPRVAVALPARQVLRRTIALPAAIEENLRQALGYDLDRHTPFKADELYFDAVIVGRNAEREEIRVDLAAARRGVVDAVLQQAESFGADVVAVVPDAPDAVGVSRLNLLPDERRPAATTWRRWQVIAPLAIFALAVLASLALPVWQKREYAIALGRQVDAARAQAAVSEGLRSELERLTGEYNFALERKFAFPPTVQVLDEITKLLPDDTWLTQMELKTSSRGKDMQRDLMVRGESANAGRLITAFEESKVFAQAAPRSPTTKIQPGPGEIFDLVAQVRPLPRPAPISLAKAESQSGDAAQADASSAATPTAPKPQAASSAAQQPDASAVAAPAPAAATPAGAAPAPPAPKKPQP